MATIYTALNPLANCLAEIDYNVYCLLVSAVPQLFRASVEVRWARERSFYEKEHDQSKDICRGTLADIVIMHGRLVLAQHLKSLGYGFGNYALDNAVLSGRLDSMQWLYAEYGDDVCSEWAASIAAGDDNKLDLLKWIYDHCSDINEEEVLGSAVLYENTKTLTWLRDHTTTCHKIDFNIDIQMLKKPTECGGTNMYEWLRENWPEILPEEMQNST